MKARVVIALCSLVLLFVGSVSAQATKTVSPSPQLSVSEQIAPPYNYVYSVKFLIGTAASASEGVQPADYATNINMHNPQLETNYSRWKVLQLKPTMKVTSFRQWDLLIDRGFFLDGPRISARLGLLFPPPNYIEGFVVIESYLPLDVSAVYTARNPVGFSLDVEYIHPSGRIVQPL